MLKYKKIGSYIVECSPLDDYTYNIALWYVSNSSLDCEVCEVFYASSYTGAVSIWRDLCKIISVLDTEKNDCSELVKPPTEMRGSTTKSHHLRLLRGGKPS